MLHNLNNFFAKIETYIVQLSGALITIILISQTVLRYVFSSPLFWAEEVATLLLVLLTFTGLSLLIYERRLISLNFILNFLSKSVQKKIRLIIDLLIIKVLGILIFFSVGWVLDPMTQLESSGTAGWSRWYIYCVLPISFVLMMFHHVMEMFDSDNKIILAEASL